MDEVETEISLYRLVSRLVLWLFRMLSNHGCGLHIVG